MKMSVALLGSAAALALSLVSVDASAQSFFFSFTGVGGSNGAFGTLNGTSNGDGSYTATSGTITEFGSVASGMGALFPNPNAPAQATSVSGFFSYDNQLFPGQTPLISNGGLLFTIGGAEINIFANGGAPGTYQLYNNNGSNVFGDFALSPAGSPAVPEPATWGMMILGFGMIGFGLRYRRKSTSVTFA